MVRDLSLEEHLRQNRLQSIAWNKLLGVKWKVKESWKRDICKSMYSSCSLIYLRFLIVISNGEWPKSKFTSCKNSVLNSITITRSFMDTKINNDRRFHLRRKLIAVIVWIKLARESVLISCTVFFAILTFFLLEYRLILFKPITTRKQYPALGNNKVLSAITKPTVKNKLLAGKKGSTMRERPITWASLEKI